MALFLARKRGRMTTEVTRSYLQRLLQLPEATTAIFAFGMIWLINLRSDSSTRKISLPWSQRSLCHRPRGSAQTQGNFLRSRRRHPAGELKHGPNALVDENCP